MKTQLQGHRNPQRLCSSFRRQRAIHVKEVYALQHEFFILYLKFSLIIMFVITDTISFVLVLSSILETRSLRNSFQ